MPVPRPEHSWLTDAQMSGGGPLDKALGDLLVDHGLNVYNVYGSSETGMQVPFIPGEHTLPFFCCDIKCLPTPRTRCLAPAGKDWDYLHIIPECQPEFIPHGDGTYELILVVSATCSRNDVAPM